VVATATGSGKTESFMLPILDSLMRENEAGTLGPGVRALLLYPTELYPTEPKGAEIAMLLRRVRDRVAPLSMLGRIPAVGGLAVARP
jgi:ATP-dependent helicase YprA (DUF1998 family)